MALLTIDEILNHSFTETKFTVGFNQDEVDAFLDRVIETMVVLQEENTDLKAKLEDAERRLAEAGHVAPAHEVGDAAEEAVHAPAVTPEPVTAPVVNNNEPESATSMLALAQRVHDEYVRDGREEGDRIIAESREQASQIVRNAEEERDRVLQDLAEKREELESKIEELKVYERDYRSQIRSHLESLLGNLESGAHGG